MKKLSLVALMAGLLSTGVVVPAQAAEPTEPAPTNVQISWKDETFQFVHVTWDEDAPRANVVYLRSPASTMKMKRKYLAADAPNAIDLPMESVRTSGIRLLVGVAVGTAAGETSPAAESVPFDTIDAGAPKFLSYTPSGTSSLQVSWQKGAPIYTDTTPGDPLDRDIPVTYQLYLAEDGTDVPIGSPSVLTSASFTGPKPPYSVYVVSRNEWGTNVSDLLHAAPMPMSASIPAWVVADKDTVIRATFGDPAGPPVNVTVTLQARNSATSAWYAVTSVKTGGNDYQFTMPSRGTRQYRIAVSNAAADLVAYYGGYTAPVTTTTQLKATVALAASSVFRSSSPVDAWLRVNPASTGTASLQRWNGTTWVAVASVPFKAGAGTGHLSAATAGTFTYRYYVPAQTYNGLPVAAAYSPNFTLKVNP
jgi:hypothetical protein